MTDQSLPPPAALKVKEFADWLQRHIDRTHLSLASPEHPLNISPGESVNDWQLEADVVLSRVEYDALVAAHTRTRQRIMLNLALTILEDYKGPLASEYRLAVGCSPEQAGASIDQFIEAVKRLCQRSG